MYSGKKVFGEFAKLCWHIIFIMFLENILDYGNESYGYDGTRQRKLCTQRNFAFWVLRHFHYCHYYH